MPYITHISERPYSEVRHTIYIDVNGYRQDVTIVDNGTYKTAYVNKFWIQCKCEDFCEAIKLALLYLGVPEKERTTAANKILSLINKQKNA